MTVQPGTMLSHYRLVEKLGEGGMGVVWKAVDTRLDREVAIKILPDHFAEDPERLARFEREAKMLAALNHRNIASIYGLEQADGVRFLAMELAQGEDLARRLDRGPLPVHEALDVAHQLARALESAHEKGVLHRDLKPANVQLSHEGRVKVLDFGLAKAFETDPTLRGNPTMSPTLTSAGTRDGTIMGTAAYMSPEQARGLPLDKRTDIWAFGCLLYECLTARSPFRGATVTDTLASIVKTQPDWTSLPAETPPRIRELLQRCLEKDVRNRLRDIGDARLELQRSITAQESFSDSSIIAATDLPKAPARRVPLPWVAVAALAGAVAGIGLWSAFRPATPSTGAGPGGVVRLSIDFPAELRVRNWQASPDGRTVVFAANLKDPPDDAWNPVRLYLRSFDAFEATEVVGGEGSLFGTFSPDGRWLAIVAPIAPRASKSRLYKIPVDGSAPPLTLLDWSDDWWAGILWLPDGDIVVRTAGGKALVRIPADGGAPGEPVPIRIEGLDAGVSISHWTEALLPDGIHLLTKITTYTERGFDNNVGLLNLETGEARILIENGRYPHWSATGHVVFSRGDAIVATPFDLDRLTTTGATVAIQAGFRAVASYGDTFFNLSRNGTLWHWPGGVYGDRRQLYFLDNERLGEPWSEERRHFEGDMEISTDGRRLGISICNDAGLYDIWIAEMDRRRLSRFVHEPGRDCEPQYWTPDGESLLYQCVTTDGGDLYLRHVDGTSEPRRLVSWPSSESYWAHAFLPDGTLVLNHDHDGTQDLTLVSLETEGDETDPPAMWLENAWNPEISPDGRWVAYQSDASGRSEVYLRALAEDHSLGREVPVTTTGADGAWWYPDHKRSPLRLRFWSKDNAWAVEITTDGGLDISDPERVAHHGRELLAKISQVDDLPDGRWLAVLKDENEALPDQLHVVLNWSEELKRRLGN